MTEKTVTIDNTILNELVMAINALLSVLAASGAVAAGSAAGATGVTATAGAAGTRTSTMAEADIEAAEQMKLQNITGSGRRASLFTRHFNNSLSIDQRLAEAGTRAVELAVAEQGLAVTQARMMTLFCLCRLNGVDFASAAKIIDALPPPGGGDEKGD
jgi:hypothetical protein